MLSPTVSGSITNVAGPAIVAVVLEPLITDIPIPVVISLSVTFNPAAFTFPLIVTLLGRPTVIV